MITEQISKELHQIYPEGKRITNKQLKAALQQIYDKFSYKRHATATQIQEYGFSIKRCKMPKDKFGKRHDGVILTMKQDIKINK